MSLIECVPNFSVGTDGGELEAIVSAVARVDGVRVLDRSADADHQRAVVTFAGEARAVGEAAFLAVAEAARRIDLREHVGVHPRMGATDVLPFVPLDPGALPLAVELAHGVGARIADELAIPIYFYGEAALLPERRALPDVRRGGFEALRGESLAAAQRSPDRGPDRVHESAGAIAVGVRPFLLAYNVNLESTDLEAARAIAAEIREKGGGLPGVRALGFALESASCVQVSTNVCDYQKSGILDVFHAVERLARARGIEVRESELVGLAPRAALDENTARAVRLRGFAPARMILEELLHQP